MVYDKFATNGYYINDTYHDGRKWLVNEVEAKEIVDIMNGLDTKARESRNQGKFRASLLYQRV